MNNSNPTAGNWAAVAGLSLIAVCLTAAAVTFFTPGYGLLAQSSASNTGKVVGFIDEVSTDENGVFVRGWACQTGVDQALTVHLYAGGKAGNGELVGAIGRTNQVSATGIHNICGTDSNVTHRYKYYFKQSELENFAGEEIFAYGVSLNSKPNKLLTKSGQFNLPDPVPENITDGYGSITGFVDETGVDHGGTFVRGWACQIGIDEEIDVHFYAGGPAGSGQFIGNIDATADESAKGIHNVCLTDEGVTHRFKHYVGNADARAMMGEEVYAYGITSSQVTAPNGKLNKSGERILPETYEPISGNEFNVFWHLGMNINGLADLAENDPLYETIDIVKSMVDGYYFMVPERMSANTYWPNGNTEKSSECNLTALANQRPFEMTLEGRYYENSIDIIEDCEGDVTRNLSDIRSASYFDYLGMGDEEIHEQLYFEGYQRMVSNLGLSEEQGSGKQLVTEMLLTSNDFTYDASNDSLVLNSNPRVYDFLKDLGLSINGVMAYQEPSIQQIEGTFVEVPNPTNESNPQLPANMRILPMLGEAFAAANEPLGLFSPNFRDWFGQSFAPQIFNISEESALNGFFFEGGTQVMTQDSSNQGKNLVESFGDGIAWLLQNTDEPIYLLLPGYWPEDELNYQADRDQIIDRLLGYIITLNNEVNEELGLPAGENSFCNDRITLIPGGYGGPFHLDPLPVSRDDGLAGTVTGQIAALSVLKSSMCAN